MDLPPFDAVVTDHGTVVMRVCRALLPPMDADDAWADTFLAALRAYPNLRADSNVRGWLVTIAHRKAIDVLRRGRRTTPVADVPETILDGEPTLADAALASALAALPHKQQQAVVLHHLAGLPHAQVAIEMGVSPAAARKNASDGIAALRRALQPEEETDHAPVH